MAKPVILLDTIRMQWTFRKCLLGEVRKIAKPKGAFDIPKSTIYCRQDFLFVQCTKELHHNCYYLNNSCEALILVVYYVADKLSERSGQKNWKCTCSSSLQGDQSNILKLNCSRSCDCSPGMLLILWYNHPEFLNCY